MKAAIISVLLFVSTVVSTVASAHHLAEHFLIAGDQSWTTSNVLVGEVIAASPLCPEGVTCVTDGTELTLRFTLSNACYELEPLAVSVNGKHVQITAVQTDTAGGLDCTQAEVEVEVIESLVNVFPPFQVTFTGAEAVIVNDYSSAE